MNEAYWKQLADGIKDNSRACFPELFDLVPGQTNEVFANTKAMIEMARVEGLLESMPTFVVPDEFYDTATEILNGAAEVIKHSDTLIDVPTRPMAILGLAGQRADVLIFDEVETIPTGISIYRLEQRRAEELIKQPRRRAQWKEETNRGRRRR